MLTALLLIALGVFVWGLCDFPLPKRHIAIQPLRPEVQAVIDLLKLDRDWQKDSHVWFHPAGIAVWIANNDYGLGIVMGAKNRHDYATATDDKGKESALKLDDRHRKAVWAVVKEIKEGRATLEADAAAKAVAKRVLEMYPDLRA